MRIIHTSDWHLGQYFFTKSRAPEHQYFLNWLIEQVNQHQVDALIVAGDIFDTGAPPSYAREIYNQFVVDLHKTGCQLVILGGNHDSVSMLNESKALLSCLNTNVVANGNSMAIEQSVIVLKDRQGEPGALFCAIPFLRPRDILFSQAGQSSEQKQQSLQQAISDYYQLCYQQAVKLRLELARPLPIIMSGHLTVVGASTTDSVREIYIGTLDAFQASGFPDADYIALGHIHRPQIIGGQSHIRYSGSPIPLSFDENGPEKSVCLVDFEQGQRKEIQLLPIPQYQPLATLKGNLQDIQQQLEQYRHYQGERPVWLDIEIASQDYLSDIQQRVEELTTGLPVEVVLLRRARRLHQSLSIQQQNETLSELTVEEVFQRRLAEESLQDEQRENRLTLLFRQSYEALLSDQEDKA
nr:exonuclease subunit SbcD [uncultured Moellerella sp.]